MVVIMWNAWRHQIQSYIHKHGRLIVGTTVLFCLICVYSLYAYYEREEVKRAEVKSAEVKVSEKAGGKKSLPENRHEETNKIVYSIRKVERVDSLRDPFLDTGGTFTAGESTYRNVEQVKDGRDEKSKGVEMERSGRIKKAHMDRKKGDSYIHKGKEDTSAILGEKKVQRRHKESSLSVIVRGIVKGDTAQVIVELGGNSYVLGLGETVHEVRVVDIERDRVLLDMRGIQRWHSIEREG